MIGYLGTSGEHPVRDPASVLLDSTNWGLGSGSMFSDLGFSDAVLFSYSYSVYSSGLWGSVRVFI